MKTVKLKEVPPFHEFILGGVTFTKLYQNLDNIFQYSCRIKDSLSIVFIDEEVEVKIIEQEA